MTTINQKEYLKKYLGLGKAPGEKKKKRKKEKATGSRLKIIDDDADGSISQEIQDDIAAANEDAPQIVAVIDERPPSLRIDEETKSKLWKPIGETSDLTGDAQAFRLNNSFKLNKHAKIKSSSDLKSHNPLKHKTVDRYESRNEFKKEPESPPQRPRRDNTFSLSSHRGDNSPHQKHMKTAQKTDRGKYTDYNYSPSRHHNEGHSLGKKRSSDDYSSPTRNNKEDKSPRKHKEDDHSPSRRRDANDYSSPRRQNKEIRSPRIYTKDNYSPPRRSNLDDYSPPRRKNNEDMSPPRRKSNKETTHLSSSREEHSPLKRRLDEDNSPPRRRDREDDNSPPRRKNRGEHIASSKIKLERDFSPPERNKDKKSRWGDWSPETSSERPGRYDKMDKTLDGKKAGLQNAKDLVKEATVVRQREDEMFKNMSEEVSGVNAATVVRKKKVKDVEEEAHKQQKEKETREKYDRWGKGLAQVESQNEKIAEQLHEMSKPLARYADDEDLEKYLKEQEREGDPMLAYIRKKKKKESVAAGIPEKPMYLGEFMPNRFGIRPGYRWDGVDRSNGYEKRWYEVQNSKRASQEEAFKWSTEDM